MSYPNNSNDSNRASGILITNDATVRGTLFLKSNGKETSRELPTAGRGIWNLQDLTNAGFNKGDTCYVSVVVEGGASSGVQSPNAFTLEPEAPRRSYILSGSVEGLSWEGPLVAKAVLDDPSSNGIHVSFDGAYTCHCWVKSNSHQSSWSKDLMSPDSCSWSFDNLVANGFEEGEDCWMGVDVDGAGAPSNHESGQNFILTQNTTFQGTYELNGTVDDPQWTRMF